MTTAAPISRSLCAAFEADPKNQAQRERLETEKLRITHVLGMDRNCDRENPSCERALLGALILDPRQWVIVESFFSGDDQGEAFFTNAARRTVWDGLLDCRAKGISEPDLTVLCEHLNDAGQLDNIGGSVYLATLVDELYSLAQVPEYCRIVLEKWKFRVAAKIALRIAHDAKQRNAAPAEVVRLLEEALVSLDFKDSAASFTPAGEAIFSYMADLKKARDEAGANQVRRGLSTGYPRLDRILGGIAPDSVVILSARPSVGKTALGLNIAMLLGTQGVPVGFQSCEMNLDRLSNRMVAFEASVDSNIVKSPSMLSVDQWEEVRQAAIRLKTLPLFIDDGRGLTIGDIQQRARKLKAEHPDLAAYFIDYLGLLKGNAKRYESRQAEVSEISRMLKSLNGELGLPIFVLAQLSRDSQKRTMSERPPQLHDLRDSGAIEQDADVVIMIDAPRPNPKASDREANKVWCKNHRYVMVRKNRDGGIGDVLFKFTPHLTLFEEETE